MRIRALVSAYFVAWRTLLYFMAFAIVLGVFLIPVEVLSMVDTTQHPILETTVVAVLLLIYLPIAVHFASRLSGVVPPTAEEVERQQDESTARKNAELAREACVAGQNETIVG